MRIGAMGQFRVDLILHPANDRPPQRVEALVDASAAYSMLPRALPESLGYFPVRAQRVILADGRTEEWMVTQMAVECQGRRTVTPVLMVPAGGLPLLGATTIEELGLGVDPLGRRLVPVDLYMA
jgi:predicted aspartyl protease